MDTCYGRCCNILAGIILIFFNMVMPGTVGDRWFIEYQRLLPVLSSWVIYLVVFTALAKYPLLPKRNLHRRE
jgi:hypothetical protein